MYFYIVQILHQVSLKPYNTFGIEVFAKDFVKLEERSELNELIKLVSAASKILILGGGSNIVFTQSFDGLVIKNNLKGLWIHERHETYSVVRAASGENWHNFVCWTLSKNLYGLENLSLIPGSVGASPIQNIGAYGIELKNTFESLEALHLKTGKMVSFKASECEFGYRESVFKHALKNQYLIVSVSFRLQHEPNTQVSYGAIKSVLASNQIAQPKPQDVANAVIQIRKNKLPDPKVLGNAGSFFKNPEIDAVLFNRLQKKHPEIIHYLQPSGRYKIAAGWLIEQCGFKGFKYKGAGVHTEQALVLVNATGNAQGNDVLELSKIIQTKVLDCFEIGLETEVNVL